MSRWPFAAALLLASASARHLPAQLPAGTSDSSSSSSSSSAADPAEERLQAEAATALDRSDFPAALAPLKTLVAHHPDDPHLRFNLASTEDALDQNTAAIADYQRAAALDPKYLEPHLGLGLLLARAGDAAPATTELTVAAAMTSGAPPLRAHAYRALAHLQAADDPAAASASLLAALKLAPEDPGDTLLSADLADRLGDRPSAEAAYQRYLAAHPNDASAVASLVRLLLEQDQLAADAEPLLTAALAAHPADPVLTAELASVYDHQGKRTQALALLQPLSAAHPEETSIARLYARLLIRNADYAAAEPLLARARIAAPADGTLADDDADALIHLKRFAEAERILEPAVSARQQFPSNESFGEAASHLAFAASQNNDPDTVLRALSLRATVLPQSPAGLFLEAIARDKLHQTKEARALYEQFLSAAGNKFPDEAWEARHRLLALEHTH